MNAVGIEQAVSALAVVPLDANEFPYAFLDAFGNKATTINLPSEVGLEGVAAVESGDFGNFRLALFEPDLAVVLGEHDPGCDAALSS